MLPHRQVKKNNIAGILMSATDCRQRGIESDVDDFADDVMEQGFVSYQDYLRKKDNPVTPEIPKLTDDIDFDDWYTKFL